MLDPRERSQLFECLRPPSGYVLHFGISTTYSLDLLTLLALPLAFTVFEREDAVEEGKADSLALLESLRRYADRLTIFCQRGQIYIPPAGRPLLAYLEKAVCEANAPGGGAFHPKVTVLRFVRTDSASIEPAPGTHNVDDSAIRYRLLCASRNLTFDRSWDTVLRLDGVLTGRQRDFAVNRPLAEFVDALPMMAVRPLDLDRKQSVQRCAAEILKTEFELPEHVETLRFCPIGHNGRDADPIRGEFDRMLVVSPFIADRRIRELAERTQRLMLVSRCESLDALNAQTLDQLQESFFLNTAIDSTDAADEKEDAHDAEASVTVTLDTQLRGLHAKLYIAETKRNSQVWTGSANATNAAGNVNVEFLIELSGPRAKLGIDAVLGRPDTDADSPNASRKLTALRDLLVPYRRAETVVPVDSITQQLDRRADELHRRIASLSLRARVDARDGDLYAIFIECDEPAPIELSDGDQVRCWPASLPFSAGLSPTLDQHVIAQFPSVSFRAITGFLAFELIVRVEGRTRRTSFVLNLPLEGAPADRASRLLLELLRSRRDVLRYLSLLLADDPHDVVAGGATDFSDHEAEHVGPVAAVPLLERLLHTLNHNPARLDAVATVVHDLRRTPEGCKLLPERFNEIWDPIWDARRRLCP